MMVNRFLLVAFAALVSSLASAQTRGARAVIDGVVTDTNLVALGDAAVSILGSDVHVATGTNGRFRFTGLPAGNYILAVHRIGYVPFAMAMAVEAADTLRPSFELQPIATALDTMIVVAKSVTARMAEFEDRRKAGVGYFITAQDIEQRVGLGLSDVIRALPSVDISTKGMFAEYAINTRGGCAYQLFLDGMRLPTPTDLHLLPRPAEIAGIEVYSGASTVPMQYHIGNSSCGVIMFWTKRG